MAKDIEHGYIIHWCEHALGDLKFTTGYRIEPVAYTSTWDDCGNRGSGVTTYYTLNNIEITKRIFDSVGGADEFAIEYLKREVAKFPSFKAFMRSVEEQFEIAGLIV